MVADTEAGTGTILFATPVQKLRLVERATFVCLIIQLAGLMVSIAVSSIAFVAALALWVLKMSLQRKVSIPSTPLDYLFLGYALAELLSSIFAVFPEESFWNMRRLFLILVVYLVASHITSRNRMQILVGTLVVVASILSVVELYAQFAFDLERVNFFQHYMTTGGIKMIVLLLLLSFVLQRDIHMKVRIAYGFASIPIVAVLMLTYTRSAWLGFLCGVAVIGTLKHRSMLLPAGVLIILFFLLAPASLTQRATSIVDLNDPTVASRLTMWSTGLKIFADYPILGVGDSDLHALYVQYRSPDDLEFGGHLHNNFLQLLVSLGLIGFGLVTALFIKIVTMELSVFRKIHSQSIYSAPALGALAVFVGFLVSGLFEWNFGDHEIITLVWCTVGLSIAVKRLDSAEAA